MKKNNPRVVIPTNALEMIQLVKDIYEKHVADGPASPLLNIPDLDMAAVHTTGGQVYVDNDEAIRMKGLAGMYFERKKIGMKSLNKNVRTVSGYLKALYVSRPHMLSEWGFSVEGTPRKKKPKT